MLKRTLTCQKPHGDGKFIPVPSVFCKGAVKPPVTEPCNTDVFCKRKNVLNNNNNNNNNNINFFTIYKLFHFI